MIVTGDIAEVTRPAWTLVRRSGGGEAGAEAWLKGLSGLHLAGSGRTAIHALARLAGLRGAEILVPAYNCGSEVTALGAAGVDVAMFRVRGDLTVDLDDLATRIGERTRAVHLIHYFGLPDPQLRNVVELCRSRGLLLIEDCAMALFSRTASEALGTLGDAAVFSLAKTLPLVTGGALRLNNPELAARARDVPLFDRPPDPVQFAVGVARVAAASLGGRRAVSALRALRRRFSSGEAEGGQRSDGLPGLPADHVFASGAEGRAMDPLARMQLAGAEPDAIVAARRANIAACVEVLESAAGVTPLVRTLAPGICPHSLPVRVGARDAVHAALRAEGIDATRRWPGFAAGLDWSAFPEAVALKREVLTLPVHQHLTPEAAAQIARRLAAHAASAGPPCSTSKRP